MFTKCTTCFLVSAYTPANTMIVNTLDLLSPEVGDVVGVADSTIRQSYRLLYPSRDKLFPPDFKFATSVEDLPKH